MNIFSKKKNFFIIILVIIIVAGVGIYFFKLNHSTITPKKDYESSKNSPNKIYFNFIDEIYNKIKQHYWDKISDDQLSQLYQLAAEKISGQKQNLFFKDMGGVNVMVTDIISKMNTKQKKEFVTKLSNMVLANLKPFGRSGLFTQQQTKALQNKVSNIDPQTDLYQILGLNKNSNQQKIEQRYKEKNQQLNKIINNTQTSATDKQKAKKELALIKRAYETLSNQANRMRYNQTKIESTVNAKLINPKIFYLHIKKISPTSFEDFQKAAQTMDKEPSRLDTLILDLRDNVGGSIDLMQWFLGPFIGPNNLAYEFFHQGEYKPFKTKTGWLSSLTRYKKVIILINGQVQSSGEVMAATLKKYNVGVLVGTKTKGWGTIEKVFPLKNQIDKQEKYSIFLVHSLTLRDDNQPIEGRGVEPDIDINQKNWDKQLLSYFNSPTIVRTVKQIWSNEP